MMRGEEKITFKNICKYLWSLIILGVNWLVYRKVFVVLLVHIFQLIKKDMNILNYTITVLFIF